MNKAFFRSFAVRLLPRGFHPMVRKVINSSAMYAFNKRLGISYYSPTWNTIRGGRFAGLALFFDASRGVPEQQMVEGTYDAYFFSYMAKEHLQGKTVFDIGAHIGYSTVCFGKLVGKKGRVIAFEPNPFNFERLRLNVDRNRKKIGTVVLQGEALSDTNGNQTFHFTNNIEDWTSSGSFLDSATTFFSKDTYLGQLGFETMSVPTMTLDYFCASSGYIPDVMKIDVEGAEAAVLQGARKVLKKYKPVLCIELHSIYTSYVVTKLCCEYKYEMSLLHTEADGRCFIIAKPRQ